MEKGYLGLEIGEKLLRFVYVVKQKGIPTLTRAGEMEINLSFNSTGSLTQTIRMIIEKEEILPKRIFVSISRKDILIHQQLLPHMNAEELAEVVPGEIEKIPFFSNQAFEFSYTAFMHSEDKDRVLIVAVSQDFLQSIIDEVDAVKLPFRDIEISPLNLRELLPKSKTPDRCEALLFVEEQCSYFCIYQGAVYLGFYRSQIGAHQISSPVNAANQDVMLSTWIGEFDRVVKSHLVDHPQTPIEHLWLVANEHLNERILTHLSKNMDITTETVGVEKMPNIRIPDSVKWNPVYLSALTPIMFVFANKKPLFAFDHFFAKFKDQKYIMLLMLKCVAFLMMFTFGIGFINHILIKDIAYMNNQIKLVNQNIELLTYQNKNLFAQKKEYLDVRNKLLAQAGYVQEINRVSWTHVLAAIASELPTQLSLTGFKFSENGDVKINGETLDITNIAELIRKVDQSSILEGGKFEFLREKKQKEAKLFNFGIQANLKAKKEASNGPR